MHDGIGRDGQHLYPAMPYPYYTQVAPSDDHGDPRLARPPCRRCATRSPSNQLPFPFNIRASMIGWNELFFKPGPFQPDPAKSAEWNRGAYLVEGLGHCGACHTPKNSLGGDDDRPPACAGPRLQGWFAPNITNDARTGLGGWSIDDIVAYLRTGHNRFAAASGPMAEEVDAVQLAACRTPTCTRSPST